ncbi:MAG TPA: ammonia-forming cytochrome c nitrite reductase subunit c552 [Deinococcales bacterium]|nr:ammonia-forming cytochrome c nitrite reductase subunit c552 [Deinococcales bacterium]
MLITPSRLLVVATTAIALVAGLPYARALVTTDDPDPVGWSKQYPKQYETYMMTAKTAELVDYKKFGLYGGADNFQRLDLFPLYKRLFAGHPFALDYKEDRGHMAALFDMTSTKRMGDNKPGSCLNCKTSQFTMIQQKIGVSKAASTLTKDLMVEHNVKYSVNCADCHDQKTMALRVERPAFIEAMARQGVDVKKASKSEMRTYVCAQCHVEYYFKAPDRVVVHPWDKGMGVDAMEKYYDEIGFKDWEHAETKAPLVKMQHPEFELFSSSIHAKSGVSCSDCHMPSERDSSGKRVTDHWIRSPLTNLEKACSSCHDYEPEELKERVLTIQNRTFELLTSAEEAIVEAQDAIKEAMAKGAKDDALAKARALQRKAQIRWDYVAAENSMGFHSPQESARILGKSIDYARQAEIAAFKAAK